VFKFSITSILALTFWVAATIASVSQISSTGQSERQLAIVALITASFSLAVLCFGFYSLFSSIFGLASSRPFWIGCSVVCWFLVTLEPVLNLGWTSLCQQVSSPIAGVKLESLQFGYPNQLNQAAQIGIAEVMRNAGIPLLSIVGGMLSSAIAMESKKLSGQAEKTPKAHFLVSCFQLRSAK
jgi:hypothetical protein